MKVVFTRSDSLIGKLIRFFSWSDWSHVAISDEVHVWEATGVTGKVMKTPALIWMAEHEIDNIDILDIELPNEQSVYDFLDSKVGSDYDFFDLVFIILRLDRSGTGGVYSCGELAAEAINQAAPLIEHTHYNRLEPRHIRLIVNAYNAAKWTG